jgi:choline kinase
MARHLDRTVATAPDLPEAELHHAIKQVCVEALEGWTDCLLGKAIEITQIAGGISNALFKVDPRSASPSDCGSQGGLQPVAVRLYGANTEQFIDRDKELAIMEVAAQHGFGPRVLATFANGRIEEFLQGRSLAVRNLARSFARIST